MIDIANWGLLVFIYILGALILMSPIIVTITNIIYVVKKKKNVGFEACLYGMGILFML